MDPKDQALLESLGRRGWAVLSKQPSTEFTTGTYPGERIPKYPEGSEQWVITDGKGHNQTMVVKPPAAYPGPYSPTTNDPGSYNPNPTVIDPPKDLPASQSSAPPGWTNIGDHKNADGTTSKWGNNPRTGVYEQIPGVPPEPAPATTNANRPPSDPSKWQPIYAKPGDATSAVVALQDPVTGDRVTVPQDAKPDKPQIIQGPRGQIYKWDGQNLTTLQQGEAAPAQPKENQTRQSVIPGTQYVGQEVYHNGVWSLDSSFTPRPYVPTDKPSEGAVRPNVVGGQSVQEVYRGGSWVVDTSVAPKPFVPQTPTTVSAPANQQFIVQQTPGQPGTTNIENPNYQPTDVAARVGQLKTQAEQKRDALKREVASGQKTDQQAASEFDVWWAANIDPVSQQLEQQQATQRQDAQIKVNQDARAQQAADQSMFTTAQTAGQNAAQRAQALLPYMVGPGYGAAVNNIAGAYASGKAPQNLDIGSAVTFNAPDFNQIAEQATAQALAHLSPMAAGKVGAPLPQVPQGIDIQAALNKSNYAPTTTISPDGTVTIQHQQSPPPQIPQIPNYVPGGGAGGGLDYALPPPSF